MSDLLPSRIGSQVAPPPHRSRLLQKLVARIRGHVLLEQLDGDAGVAGEPADVRLLRQQILIGVDLVRHLLTRATQHVARAVDEPRARERTGDEQVTLRQGKAALWRGYERVERCEQLPGTSRLGGNGRRHHQPELALHEVVVTWKARRALGAPATRLTELLEVE